MKRLIIAALLGMVCIGIAQAQGTVCDPVAIGTSPSNTGSGSGPNYAWMINGQWHPSEVFTVPGPTVTFGDVQVWGFVNVFSEYHAGFTCMAPPWNAVLSFKGILYDLSNDGQEVEHCCLQNVLYESGKTGGVPFNYAYGSGPGTITLTIGHKYMWQMNVSASFYGGLGVTPLYNSSVQFTVE